MTLKYDLEVWAMNIAGLDETMFSLMASMMLTHVEVRQINVRKEAFHFSIHGFNKNEKKGLWTTYHQRK